MRRESFQSENVAMNGALRHGHHYGCICGVMAIYSLSVLYGETLHSSPSNHFSMIPGALGDPTAQFTHIYCRIGTDLP